MKNEFFANISKIIERDSKSTTYKFALLRGVIDMIQDHSPYITFTKDRVSFPTGLLIEKWILYYYPILASELPIPQIHGGAKLAFEAQLKDLIAYYKNRGGFSAFYNDLQHKGIPQDIIPQFLALVSKVKSTVTQMPMKYIGRSISDSYYSIFQFSSSAKRKSVSCVDLEYLIAYSGSFSIHIAYYEALQFLGSFIGGQDSILFKWAEFSVNASQKSLNTADVLEQVLASPITERDVLASKQLYKSILAKEGKVPCVWTGKLMNTYDIDHVIPFSVWRNNDLWNLMPASKKANSDKKDKIPSPDLIEKQKDRILSYWEMIFNSTAQERFKKELQVALLGNVAFEQWLNTGIQRLQSTCTYLIETRGFGEWKR